VHFLSFSGHDGGEDRGTREPAETLAHSRRSGIRDRTRAEQVPCYQHDVGGLANGLVHQEVKCRYQLGAADVAAVSMVVSEDMVKMNIGRMQNFQ